MPPRHALVERLRRVSPPGFRILTPEETRSSIVSFYIKEESPAAAEKILEEARVKVSLQNGDRTEGYGATGAVTRVRVSLSFFNNTRGVDRFLEVSEKLGTT